MWFSFWGEASFRPRYAEIARDFDTLRGAEILRLCAGLMPDADDLAAVARACYGAPSGTGGRSSVVEHLPSKQNVVGSTPIARSISPARDETPTNSR